MIKTQQIQNLSNFKLPPNFRGRSEIIVQLWWLVQGSIFRYSPQFLYGWRIFLLRFFGAKIGNKVLIRPTVKITYPWKLQIGNYSWIGDDVVLYCLGEIKIGENVVISQKSYLCAASHNYKKPEFDIFSKRIIIEDESWIATDVYIHPGVTIGKGAVVGARSSVFTDLPPAKICFGSPAKPIKDRFNKG
jgi:putative colanic acid biosynthesis acetyltransferase WcaF